MIPVRCYSCNKIIANKWKTYKKDIEAGISAKDALDKIGLTRYCCRRMLLGHVDLVDKMLMYCSADDQAQ